MLASIVRVLVPVLAGVGFLAITPARAQPGNDNCPGIAIRYGTFIGTTVGATTTGVTNCVVGTTSDVFYNFTPTCNGRFRFSLCGSSFDTVLSIHSACPPSAANTLVCNDDDLRCRSDTAHSSLAVDLLAGTRYFVRIAGARATGAFVLDVSPVTTVAPPANDDCADAIPLLSSTPYFGSTLCATPDGDSTCGPSTASPDVWYRFSVPCDGLYRFSTCGSSFDTVLSLHVGCPATAANEVACNDDACGFDSQLVAALDTRNVYTVRVGGYQGASGDFVLSVAPVAPTLNDECSVAVAIPAAGGSFTGSTLCALNDGSANCGSSATSPDVWYRYTAGACAGLIRVDTFGSTYDTVLSIHAACPGTIANQIACNDDVSGGSLQSRVFFLASPGATYLIRVGGFSGARGNFDLHLSPVPNDRCADALPIALGDTPFSTLGATTGDAGNICTSFGSDIWYLHRTFDPGLVQVATCGTADFDTAIAVYDSTTFTCGSMTGPVACGDDGCGLQTIVRFRPVRGRDYYLRVGGYAGFRGCGTLSLRQFCPADLDDGSGTGAPDGGVTIDDLLYFLDLYAAGTRGADLDDGSETGTPDGGVTVDDLLYFVARFQGGC